MSEITDKTDELFMAASRSDDDLGYPADVAFVPSDEEWTDDVLWRNLIEGQAAVLVGEDTELLLVPLRRGVIDRLRGRVPVSVAPPNAWARLVLRDVESSRAKPSAPDARPRARLTCRQRLAGAAFP